MTYTYQVYTFKLANQPVSKSFVDLSRSMCAVVNIVSKFMIKTVVSHTTALTTKSLTLKIYQEA